VLTAVSNIAVLVAILLSAVLVTLLSAWVDRGGRDVEDVQDVAYCETHGRTFPAAGRCPSAPLDRHGT